MSAPQTLEFLIMHIRLKHNDHLKGCNISHSSGPLALISHTHTRAAWGQGVECEERLTLWTNCWSFSARREDQRVERHALNQVLVG